MKFIVFLFTIALSILISSCSNKEEVPVDNPNNIIGTWRVSHIVNRRSHPRFEYLRQLLSAGAQLTLTVNPDGSGNFELTHFDPASGETCRLKTHQFSSNYCCEPMHNIYTNVNAVQAIEHETGCTTRHLPQHVQGLSLTEIIQRFPGGSQSDAFHFTHTKTGIIMNPVDFSDESLEATQGNDTHVEIHFLR